MLNGKSVAVKRVKAFEVLNEIKILKMLPKNPFVVNFIGTHEYKDDPNVYIIMEACEKSLHDEIQLSNGLNEPKLMALIECFVKGFQFLLKYNIVHADMKPQNMLVVKNGYKIADFGLSIIAPQNEPLKRAGGTFFYCHPTVFKWLFWNKIGVKEPKDKIPWSIDLYSIGASIYEAITCKPPFDAADHKTMYKLISKKRDNISGTAVDGKGMYTRTFPSRMLSIKNEKLKDSLRSLIIKLLAHEEEKMMTFQEFFKIGESLMSKK